MLAALVSFRISNISASFAAANVSGYSIALSKSVVSGWLPKIYLAGMPLSIAHSAGVSVPEIRIHSFFMFRITDLFANSSILLILSYI